MTVTEAGQFEFTNPAGDSILMGKGTDIRVESSTGLLDFPEKVGSTEVYGDRDGGYYNAQGWLGVRRCIFTVGVHQEADSEATHALLEELITVLVQGEEDGYLTVQRPGKQARRLNCHVIRSNFDGVWSVHKGLARGAFEVEAGDPLWYSEEATEYGTGMQEAAEGRTYDRVYPMTYGALGEGGVIIVTNEGNRPAKPILRITGPVDTPIVYNVTGGKLLKFDLEIPAGQFLEVDLNAHTVLLNGVGNRRSTLNYLSEWWSLAPGDNEIRFQGNIYQADAKLEIEMRSAWATA